MQSAEVISFWFEEISPKAWWKKDPEFDSLVKHRFLSCHQAANAGELYHWRESPAGRLAEIIVLDQFSRNIFRDTPRAFSSDPLALVLAQEAVARGADREIPVGRRSFLYMPFMHSESLAMHELALDLFKADGMKDNLDFEHRHMDIIKRFGRFPHRNRILGRESTREELEFLQQPGSAF